MYQQFINFKNCVRNNKIIKTLMIFFILSFTIGIFFQNNFNIAKSDFFNSFQKDSESLVLGKIINDKYSISNTNYGLGFAYIDENRTYGPNTLDSYVILKDNIEAKKFNVYQSQVGLQGFIYSFIFNNLNINKIKALTLATSIAMAITIFLLSYLLWIIIGKEFAIIFYLSMILSPWIVSFSSNLYWVSFTWFLPAIFSFLVFVDIDNKRKYIWLFCFMLSIFIKSLCGYEYLSTIVLFALSVFFIAPFLENTSISKNKLLKYIVIIFGLSIFGFLLAIGIHSLLRGEGDLLLGLKNIYEQDVLRRTFGGDATKFNPVYSDSFNASFLNVIFKYIFMWQTDLVKGILGITFIALIIINIIMLLKFKKSNSKNLNIAMFIIFLLPALSWYFLGKSHSYIHTHMNFVLWYFGFVAVLFYIPFQYIKEFCINDVQNKENKIE